MKNLLKRNIAKLKENQGFTLVELMVVIVIIAILAAIALPAFSGILDDSKNTALAAEAKSVHTMLSTEYNKVSLMGVASSYTSFADLLADCGLEGQGDDFFAIRDGSTISVAVAEVNGGKFIVVENGNVTQGVDAVPTGAVALSTLDYDTFVGA